jgi:hypothetical protein
MTSLRPTLTVVGRRLDPEHHRLRDFLTRVAQPFEWVEAGTEEADRVLGERALARAGLPVVIDPPRPASSWPGTPAMVRPSAWPGRWARARWRWRWCTAGSTS